VIEEILIVLGAPNTPTGALSEISISRLNYCVKLYVPGTRILCTGGWGKHFNTSNEPHALHAKRYLITKGLLEKDFLVFALSENTVDDAVKIKEIVPESGHPQLTVITSDYHMERVQLIFSQILNDFKITYLGAKTELSKEELQPLIDHERAAIKSIIEKGLYW
jgi:uncharacterized SAM-binding protein YcdF (DUF218 family)